MSMHIGASRNGEVSSLQKQIRKPYIFLDYGVIFLYNIRSYGYFYLRKDF